MNEEDVGQFFKKIKTWFCTTKQDQAFDNLKFLFIEKDRVSDFALINKFHELSLLSGDGERKNFRITESIDLIEYEIDLGGAQNENFIFSVSNKPKTPKAPVPTSHAGLGLPTVLGCAVGAALTGLAAFSYFRPDFRERLFQNACNEVYGLINCSYSADQGWRDFSLNLNVSQKISNILNLAAARLTGAAEYLAYNSSSLVDANYIYQTAAMLPVLAVKRAIDIACWQLQLNITRSTWDGLSRLVFSPPARTSEGAPSGDAGTSKTSFRRAADITGLYLSSSLTGCMKGFLVGSWNHHTPETQSLLPLQGSACETAPPPAFEPAEAHTPELR